MKNKVVNIIAFSIIGFFIVGNIVQNYEWFELQHKIESTNQKVEQKNRDEIQWIHLVDSIYGISDSSYEHSLQVIEELMSKNEGKSRILEDLFFIKGNIQYKYGQIDEAINSLKTHNDFKKQENPKYLALMAGCLIKKKQFATAEKYLILASQKSHSYHWHLGNYFEIINRKEEAIRQYQELFLRDTTIYQKCKLRIEELEKEGANFLNSIVYDDDRKRKYFSIGRLNINF